MSDELMIDLGSTSHSRVYRREQFSAFVGP
jgi:hypothetical protein